MKLISKFSLKRKLNLITISIAFMVLLISAVLSTGYKVYSFRQTMLENLATLAAVTAYNSSAAIVFFDQDSARETLSALKVEPNIVSAAIFDLQGQIFASYGNDHELIEKSRQLIDPDTRYAFDNEHLHMSQPINLDDEQLGTIYIVSNLTKLYQDIKFNAMALSLVVLISVLISYLLSSRLHDLISKPILSMADKMNMVSHDKNYSIRIEKQRNDELGILIEGFNDMLSQIQSRDKRLEKQRDELEDQVKERTAALENQKNELEQALEEIKILTVTDPLTESYNRTYLTDNLPHELKRAKRYRHPISVIMCDIDYFKQINDTYGHQAGDQVLMDFVLCVMDHIRVNVDWVVRYGGEEFLIILPETDLTGALCLGERLRKSVEETEIRTGMESINITASFGVACYTPDSFSPAISPEAMINLADECMYRAKDGGRNRVIGELTRSKESQAHSADC